MQETFLSSQDLEHVDFARNAYPRVLKAAKKVKAAAAKLPRQGVARSVVVVYTPSKCVSCCPCLASLAASDVNRAGAG